MVLVSFHNREALNIMDPRLQRLFQGMGGGRNAQPADGPVVDTAEKVHISSLALLKMLKHGRFCHSESVRDYLNSASNRSSRSPHGGYGPDAGPVRR